MADNPNICHICDQRHISKPSTIWCPECEQAFCSECIDFHKFSRSSQNHVTLTIEEYLAIAPFVSDIKHICSDHNEKYQMFCQSHEDLLCAMCIENHVKCRDVIPLSKLTENVKASESFYETRQSLLDINDNITIIQQELEENLESLKQDKALGLTEISKIRKRINKHLDQIEQKLKNEVDQEIQKGSNDIKDTLRKLDIKKKYIVQSLQQIDDLKKYASDFQTFCGLKNITLDISAIETFVKSTVEGTSNKIVIKCFIDETLNSITRDIQHFGSIQIQKVNRERTFARKKDRQAQLVGTNTICTSIQNIKVNLVKKVDTEGLGVRGCDILPSNQMVFCDDSADDKCIVVFDAQAKDYFEVIMKPYFAVDIACIDYTTVAVSSSKFGYKPSVNPTEAYKLQGICIVDIKSKKVTKFVKMKNRCHGISYNNGFIICCAVEKGIQLIDIESENVTTIVECRLPVWTYLTVFQDKIYYTNGKDNTITCCGMNGIQVWKLEKNDLLKNPLGVSVDNFGNVYVACASECSVVVISSDGQLCRQILSKKDGLENPRALHYDRIRNRLLVANKKDMAFLFGVSF